MKEVKSYRQVLRVKQKAMIDFDSRTFFSDLNTGFSVEVNCVQFRGAM